MPFSAVNGDDSPPCKSPWRAIAIIRIVAYNATMNTNLLRTKDVAAMRGCHPATVARVAKLNRIGQRTGRDWLFSKIDAKRLCKLILNVGNPTFGKPARHKG